MPALRCPSCNALHTDTSWEALELVERLRHDQLGHLLSSWPWSRNVVLEIRNCRCGGTLTSLCSDTEPRSPSVRPDGIPTLSRR